MKYLVITLDDASTIATVLRASGLGTASPDVARIEARMRRDTGADMEEIVDLLQGAQLCAACKMECQEKHCEALLARKEGRRLRRLLERARGERGGGP